MAPCELPDKLLVPLGVLATQLMVDMQHVQALSRHVGKAPPVIDIELGRHR